MKKGHETMTDEPVTIEIAYNELSQEAFAVWIRMMVAADKDLTSGRKHIATVLGYSEGRSNQILRELKNKGYVQLQPGPHPGIATEIIVARRPIISGRNRFVRLSSHLQDTISSEMLQVLSFTAQPGPESDTEVQHMLNAVAQDFESPNTVRSLWDSPMASDSLSISSFKNGQKTHKAKQKSRKKWTLPIPSDLDPAHEIRVKRDGKRRKAFVTPGGGIDLGSEIDHGRELGGGISINKMRANRSEGKEKKKRDREKRTELAKTRIIDWTKLDQRGAPAITFEPTKAQRQEWITTLKLPNNSTEKRELLAKLGTEFSRIYTRYRKMYEGTRGTLRNYEVFKKEKRYCRTIGAECIMRHVTPRQLIEYWHANIKDFAGMSNQDLPSLVFLSGGSNVEKVYLELPKDRKWKSGDFIKAKQKQSNVHGFSDVTQLDVRIRAGLKAAGFDIRLVSDRYLITIQKAAATLARGKTLFVSSDLKPMVDWVIDNLLGGVRGED